MTDRFGCLLTTLNQSELEMTSSELADFCWLQLNASKIQESTRNKFQNSQEKDTKKPSSEENHKPNIKTENKQTTPPSNASKPPEIKSKQEDASLFPPRPQNKAKNDILTFPVDNPTDLGRSLGLARALKRLLKQVPALGRLETLDEIKTIDNYAATNKAFLAPFFKPVLEPWLEIALVVDGHSSLEIWHQTIDDLILFLRNYGIFRDVQVWKLAAKQNRLTLYKGLKVNRARISTPKELLNPNGRRLILVLSDCVADYWEDGSIYPLLELWQKTNPVSILQMLPEWLWLKTGLGEGAKVTLFSNEPGTKNRQLRIKDILLWEDVFEHPKALKLPIFTLDSGSIEQWSGLVAGQSNSKVAGFVLASQDLDQKETEDYELEEQDSSAIAKVMSFRNNSSPLAQELAELLAAVPTIFLPVVRLIRREILPEAGQVQIAEVFLGGILKVSSDYPQSSDPDLVLYDFVDPKVRQILQKSSTRSTNIKVFERVSRYIADRIGIELRRFYAELKKPPEEINSELKDLKNIIYPFAKVTKEILETLGGDYARFAKEELKAAKYNLGNFPPLQDLPYESATIVLLKDIELQTQQFEVAEVVIEREIYETFEFVTAKLERKSANLLQRLNPFGQSNEWTIYKQTRQRKQLIEQLSDEVELEMVLIPPGEFMMGAAPREEGSSSSERPQHKVNIEYSFLMGKYPITQAQWRTVAALPQVNRELKADPSYLKGDKRPVQQVNWYDAVEFCQRLSQHTEREYRLPSEAEWEYACRAGTTTPFHFGETITTELANYNGKQTTPVGNFLANDFGLCDMHGNVLEWCEDLWHGNYQNAPTDGSSWTTKSDSSDHVLRGGSCFYIPRNCRSATRSYNFPEYAYVSIGFRVVCRVPIQ